MKRARPSFLPIFDLIEDFCIFAIDASGCMAYKGATMSTIRVLRTKNFCVRVESFPEEYPDFSFDDDVRKQVESGELQCFRVQASVLVNGVEIATDHLGNCIYKDPSEFQDHKGIRNYSPEPGVIPAGRCGSYFSDMIKTVCSSARDQINAISEVKVRRP